MNPPLYQTSLGTPRDIPTLLSMKSQGFGDNVSYYSNPAIWPHPTQGHPGIDWGCHVGTPIYSPVDGKIRALATDFRVGVGFGAGVTIENSSGDILLWHLSQISVSLGQTVRAGQRVGLSGNSGVSTAPHCHLEYRPFPLQGGNLYNGAVDPAPFLVWSPPLITTDIMTQDEVKKLYALAFYREPDAGELAYWVGKSLADFLAVAIKDRANFLTQHE